MNETTTNSEYQRLVSHLTYLKMDMMIEHLDEVLDQISGQSLNFVEAVSYTHLTLPTNIAQC